MKIELKAQARDVIGRKVSHKRKEGLIPAVTYGNKKEAVSVWLTAKEFRKVYTEAGETTIIPLSIDSEKNKNVLIHSVQFDPIDQSIIHVDLFEVDMKKNVDTDVELRFTGESPAVKEDGGVLVRGIDVLPVRCLPADLPSEIIVDISSLVTFDDAIRVKDIVPNDKVETQADENTIVASVSPPRMQDEAQSVPAEGEASAEEEKKEGEGESEGEEEKKDEGAKA